MIYVILAVIVGGIYYQLGHSSKDGIQNRVGALFFIVINMVYSNMSAVELFLKQRVIFMHESVSGYYAVSSYFLAKVVCDMIPLRIIPVAAFSAICYYMIGFQKSLEKFFFFLLSLVLTSLTASATAFLFSSLVRIQALATLFLALTFTFMMVRTNID
jgi:ATP-binding cassette subfamily G (WHITE) protein 2